MLDTRATENCDWLRTWKTHLCSPASVSSFGHEDGMRVDVHVPPALLSTTNMHCEDTKLIEDTRLRNSLGLRQANPARRCHLGLTWVWARGSHESPSLDLPGALHGKNTR